MVTTVRDILDALAQIAPSQHALPDDRIGLQVGLPSDVVRSAVVTFDASLASFAFAKEVGAQLVVAHHPLIWMPIKRLTGADYTSRRTLTLARSGLSFIAAHTNWDACPGGLNDFLAEQIGLSDIRPFGSRGSTTDAKLVVYCPAEQSEALIDALAEAGAGCIGAYARCAFVSPGTGTFEPGTNTNPTIGTPGTRAHVDEMRIEMIVPEGAEDQVRAALIAAHPYEEPAYDFLTLMPRGQCPIGRIGRLAKPMGALEFRAHLDTTLQTRTTIWGASTGLIECVAVVGGAADDEWRAAQAAGADVLVTGEVKQHTALEASESDFLIAASGHYATEFPSCERLRRKLEAAVPGVDWKLFAPKAGEAGRPL